MGKQVTYEENYAPQLLQGVPRKLGRDAIGLEGELPFKGVDIWNGYELSWLNNKGKPCVAILVCEVPIDSPFLIESKSFKLYLNSFNQSRFGDIQLLSQTIEKDLSQCAGKQVNVSITPSSQFSDVQISTLPGLVIDDLDVEISTYQPDPSILNTSSEEVEETLVSHLLKSNCLITSQPDWASVCIRYEGPKIIHETLLQYLISFRQHNEFHEQCVERLFNDIQHYCKPEKLSVYARYTRRGGLDINPFRSNFEQPYENFRLARQ